MFPYVQMLFGDRNYHSSMNNFDEAIRYYNDAAVYLSQSAEPFIKLGLCHEKMRDFDEAIRYFRKALRREKS